MTTLKQLQTLLVTPIKELMPGMFHKDNAPRVTCTDGTTLSVQASQYHYSEPRENTGPYTEVEVGFPSIVPPESWMDYSQDVENPTDTVYAYIPLTLVAEFVDAHGGIAASVKLKETA